MKLFKIILLMVGFINISASGPDLDIVSKLAQTIIETRRRIEIPKNKKTLRTMTKDYILYTKGNVSCWQDSYGKKHAFANRYLKMDGTIDKQSTCTLNDEESSILFNYLEYSYENYQ